MHRSTPVRRRGPNGRFISSADAPPAITPPQAHDFFALPPEVRCAVYRALFNRTEKLTLRRRMDVKVRDALYMTLFDNKIVRTCKTICAEALPIFYSTQKFHYTAGTQTEGVDLQPLFLPEHTKWIKYLSIGVTVNSQTSKKLDSTVATHVQTICKRFTRLASFTLHVIPAIETGQRSIPNDLSHAQASGVFDQGAAAEALRTLYSKIVLLRIVMFGDWYDLHPFRTAIAGDKEWVQGDKCWHWPGLTLTGAQFAAVNVRQRRYTLVGSENVIHPHKRCIRIFDLYKPWLKQRLTKKEH